MANDDASGNDTFCEVSCGFDRVTCMFAANAAGFNLGSVGNPFEGQYSSEGCYTFNDGQFVGSAFYGLAPIARQIEPDSGLQPDQIRLNGTSGYSQAVEHCTSCTNGTDGCPCGYDRVTCRLAAEAARLTLGTQPPTTPPYPLNDQHPFVGDYSLEGCYAINNDVFNGVAFYGLGANGGEITSDSQITTPIVNSDRYRLPGTHGCTAPTTGTR